jgi:hypothetical protein
VPGASIYRALYLSTTQTEKGTGLFQVPGDRALYLSTTQTEKGTGLFQVPGDRALYLFTTQTEKAADLCQVPGYIGPSTCPLAPGAWVYRALYLSTTQTEKATDLRLVLRSRFLSMGSSSCSSSS